MLLCIDTGNTQTVIGLFDGARLADHWRIATVAERTADELALMIQQFLGFHGFAPFVVGERGVTSTLPVTGLAVSSGVPRVTTEIREMCERYFGFEALVLEPGVRTGMPILYDNPKEVGADRIVNTLAAYTLHGGPAVVVDFGTSTNFDVVSRNGEFLGGVLAPGIEISVDALASRAAQLMKVQLVRPRSVIGKNTVESLQSGIIYGFAAQVDGITERIIAELGAPATVIATGGLAQVVLEECQHIDVHEPWLTLIGLRLMFERNTT